MLSQLRERGSEGEREGHRREGGAICSQQKSRTRSCYNKTAQSTSITEIAGHLQTAGQHTAGHLENNRTTYSRTPPNNRTLPPIKLSHLFSEGPVCLRPHK